MYKLPLGISIPLVEDYPKGEDVNTINRERQAANINEGFTLKDITDKKYNVFAEVNIDCDELWMLFKSLAENLLPEEAYGIIGVKGEEVTLSDFTDKAKIINIYEDFKFEICNDGFIQCGIAYYNEDSLTEILITSFKYLQIWSSDKYKLIDVLESFNLYEEVGLKFIDEFPVISYSLSEKNEKAKNFLDIINNISEKFERLA